MWTFQSNMTRGEIDPQLFGRVDLEAYYNGVQTAENVLCVPQGGLKKRDGTLYLNDITIGGSDDLGVPRLESFGLGDNDWRLLVIQEAKNPAFPFYTEVRVSVYAQGVLEHTFDIPLGTSSLVYDLERMDFAQALNTFVMCHPNHEPVKVTRVSSTSWLVSTPITNIPKYDYNDGQSPAPTSQVQTLVFTNIAASDRFKLSLNGILTEEIVYSGDTTADQRTSSAQAIQSALQDHPLTSNSGVTVAWSIASTYNVTFAGSAANDYKLITASSIFTQSATFSGVATISTPGTSRAEDVWSDTRGWPLTVTFHEARLWFGGSTGLPNTIWGSRINDFFNFDVGKSFDDEAVVATLDTDQLNQINAIFSNRSLQIFTSGGEFYVPASPITPTNIAVAPQTRLGSKKVRPVTLNGLTYFVQRTGKALNGFLFLDDIKSNTAEPVSILAPHLINNPTQLAIKVGSESSDVNYIYIVGSDGNLTVFNSVPSQAVEGFTNWTMDADIISVAVVDDLLYLAVVHNGVYMLCREASELNTDLSAYNDGAASTTLTGLSHLEGETVVVKGDGDYKGMQAVSSGAVTFDPAASVREAGLEFTATVKTMPLNMNLQSGPIAAKRKRIRRAALQLFESNGVIVNGQRITDKTIGVNQFSAPSPQTDLRRIYLGGWSIEAALTITQDTPFDMQILSIGLEVSI